MDDESKHGGIGMRSGTVIRSGGSIPLREGVGRSISLKEGVGGSIPLKEGVGGSISLKEGVRGSIPLRDKMIMHLQEQADCKKKQLKTDYRLLKESVKENPYLQLAVEEYDKYFALQKKQLDALKNLLKTIDTVSDQWQIKREIAALEKNLA